MIVRVAVGFLTISVENRFDSGEVPGQLLRVLHEKGKRGVKKGVEETETMMILIDILI